jgi:hypothetical protein
MAELDRLRESGELSAGAAAEAVARAKASGNPVETQLVLAEILRSLSPDNARAAVEALWDFDDEALGSERVLPFVFAWGTLDGPTAAKYALEEVDGLGPAAREVMREAVAGWAARDLRGAMAWVEGLGERPLAGAAVEGMLQPLAEADLPRATAFVLEWADSVGLNPSHVEIVARSALKGGVGSAAGWVDSLPPGEIQGCAFGAVAVQYLEEALVPAADWVTRYAGEPFADYVVSLVALELAGRDIDDAVDWVEALPEGENRAGAFSALMHKWADRDAAAASAFLTEMAPGEDRDHAVSAFASIHAREAPLSALAWAETITDENLRTDATIDSVTELGRRDPAAAAAWLEASDLAPELKEEIARDIQVGLNPF